MKPPPDPDIKLTAVRAAGGLTACCTGALRIIRWLLTIPAAISGWTIGLIVALLLHQISERWCPAEHLVSGRCVAPWSSFASDAYLVVGSVICGTLSVLFPVLMAPSHTYRIALIAYASGLACSAYWLAHGHWVPVAWAAAAGAMTVWRIKTILARRASAPPAVDVCCENISRRTD